MFLIKLQRQGKQQSQRKCRGRSSAILEFSLVIAAIVFQCNISSMAKNCNKFNKRRPKLIKIESRLEMFFYDELHNLT